jgi:hypothetical protein
MQESYTISKEEARELLIPFAQSFYEAITGGFQDYKTYDSGRGHIHNKTVKSNLVRSYVVDRLKKLVIENSNLRLIEKQRMLVVAIGDKLRVRFKKLDKKYRSQNVRTKQSLEFRNRTITFNGQQALPMDAGWRVDRLYNEISDVHFVCPDGVGNLWRIPLTDLAAQKGQAVFFPVPENEIIQIVTPKPGKESGNRKKTG